MLSNGMSINSISKQTGKSSTSVRYWCRKYGLKSNHVPFNAVNITHNCGNCGETDPSKFYGKKKKVCGKCHNKYTTELGIEKREFIIKQMGGSCRSCGFNKYRSALQVHHLDPLTKDKSFTSIRGWNRQRILDEIQGCVLLCACCHSAVHSGELELSTKLI
jgi:hypothetical protein